MNAGDVRYFIGIDPGVSGGIAVIDQLGIVQVLYKMPDTIPDLLAILAPFDQLKLANANPLDPGRVARAALERVNAGVFGHGKAGKMGVTSAFTFGRGVGRLETALAACRVPYDEVSPITWQSALGCKSGGDKNVTKKRAQQLFPAVAKLTHAIADALLLAEYCRRYWRVGDPREKGQRGEEENDRTREKVEREKGQAGGAIAERVPDERQRATGDGAQAAATGAPANGASAGRDNGRDPRADRRRSRSQKLGER